MVIKKIKNKKWNTLYEKDHLKRNKRKIGGEKFYKKNNKNFYKHKVLFQQNAKHTMFRSEKNFKTIKNAYDSDNVNEQESSEIGTSEVAKISTVSNVLDNMLYKNGHYRKKIENAFCEQQTKKKQFSHIPRKSFISLEQFEKQYKKYKVKTSKQISLQDDTMHATKTEYNNSQASSKSKMLSCFCTKQKKNDTTQPILKKITKALKEYLLLGKEKIGTMTKTALLYILGLLALILVPIILVLAIVCNSPFAVFIPSEGAEETVKSVTSSYISEFNQVINDLAGNSINYDTVKTIYINHEGDSESPSNYYDILAVYMVKHGIGNMATVMDQVSKENLKQVFTDMCHYTTKEKTEIQEDGTAKKVLLIKVTLKTYHEMISFYKLSEEETKLLEVLMSPESHLLLGNILEEDDFETGMNGQFDSITSNISNQEIKTVLEFALSKLGYPYSQAYRDSGKYYDCSSLTYYAWRSVGVNLTYEGANTAAQQAKLCNDKGYTVSYADIQPGDLIFYSFGYNGRYKNISHVAIYCGDGMLVDASYSQQKVVYRKVYSRENIVLIGRPSK